MDRNHISFDDACSAPDVKTVMGALLLIAFVVILLANVWEVI